MCINEVYIKYVMLLMIPDDGILRMYLRGRAVNMYAPTNVGDYQVNKPGAPPNDKLKLEWAYPFQANELSQSLNENYCNWYIIIKGIRVKL